MRNIPSNDPGLLLVPGDLQLVCEWLVRLAGSIATCVECAEVMVDHVIQPSIPASAAEDTALAQDLINRGQASANGATDSVAASQQMTRLGIPNVQYGWDWFAANDFVPVAQAALRRGMPVLFGVYAAFNLHDDWSNSPEDQGVYGHGITLFGFDSTGAIVGDPNTSQAQNGDFVHYTWADLRNAGGQYPSMVVPSGTRAGGAGEMVNPVWDATAGTLAFPAHDGVPAITLSHAQAYWANSNRAGVFPLTNEFAMNAAGDGCVLWSDSQKSIAVKGQGWAVHLESEAVDLEAALKAASDLAAAQANVQLLTAQTVKDKDAIGALTVQVVELQKELAAAQGSAGNPALLKAVQDLLASPSAAALLALVPLAK